MRSDGRPAGSERRLLSGWGGTAPTAADVVAAAEADVERILADPPARGVIGRGLGRAYGDAAQNAGGTVLELSSDTAPIELDAETGLVTASGGTSFDALMRVLLPRGYFVPVTPGTRHVTVGGAVAADIHGKNHHVDGSWIDHVVAMSLAPPGGEVRAVSRREDAPAFWATAGGMGLTGVVTACTFRALAVETSLMVVDTARHADLDAVLAAMVEAEARYRYSVAWIDLGGRRRSFGRGVSTGAEHAPLAAVDGRTAPLAFAPRPVLTVPAVVPGRWLNPWTIRAFNQGWFQRSPQRRTGEVQTIASFFHPLDRVDGWNRLYGRRGFVQWQCAVPDGAEATLQAVVERLHAVGAASLLTVLKRLGPGNEAPLSFPMRGWTLAIDLAAATPALAGVLDGLDRLVAAAGGRLYLAKDARMAPELVPVMYPQLDEWRLVRDRLDPGRHLCSDLARRLDLTGDPEWRAP